MKKKLKISQLNNAFTSLSEEPKLFKEKILHLYKMFPSSFYTSFYDERFTLSERHAKELVKHGFLIDSGSYQENKNGQKRRYFALGPNSLLLVNSWRMERMTKWIIGLTIATVLLSFLMIILNVLMLINV